jgi:hypothetical protein
MKIKPKDTPRLKKQREENEERLFSQGFTEKKDLGGGVFQYSKPIVENINEEDESIVGSSFNKMLGGNLPSMSSLEAASMRLADAAAKREKELIAARGAQEYGLQTLRGQQQGGFGIWQQRDPFASYWENYNKAYGQPIGTSSKSGPRTFKWAGGESIAAA